MSIKLQYSKSLYKNNGKRLRILIVKTNLYKKDSVNNGNLDLKIPNNFHSKHVIILAYKF
jgi:hypothetical protein